MKLKLKLSLMVIAIMAIVIATATTVLVQRATKIAKELTKDKVTYLVRQRCEYWAGRVDGFYQVLHTISNNMNYYENVNVNQRRDQYEATINSIFEDVPDFIRLFTIWKPDALDGMDSRYIGRVGSTETGQFAYALSRETGQIVPQTSLVVQEAMTFMNSGSLKDDASHPTATTVAGKQVNQVRLMVPIVNKNNQVVGVVGAQVNLDMLQPRIESTMKNFDEISAISIYSSNGFIMASYAPDR
ncbi:MAG: hypothetical protein LBC76_11490, partial [Treponema sp.]|nr:hypothetical protein [Treponema sp.]